MFRKKYRLGYKREVVRNDRGEPVIRRNGRVYTVYTNDLSWAETMDALRRELNQQGTIPDVAEALNAARVPAPWMIRTSGDRVWQWRGMYIRSIITDSLYYGAPAFMTNEPGPVWDQFMAVDPDFDPRKLRWRLPDLAWWTKSEALAWQHKFLDNYVKSRHRKHHHIRRLRIGTRLCCKTLQGSHETGQIHLGWPTGCDSSPALPGQPYDHTPQFCQGRESIASTHQTSIDQVNAASDIARFFAQKPDHEIGDLVGRPVAAEWNASDHRLASSSRIARRACCVERLNHARIDITRCDCVDPHSEAS
jgi:hypothetical protein